MVAPLTYGAGLKGKITQALAAGLPVVTTTIGAEGLNTNDGDGLLISDDAAGLAERIVRVLVEDDLWSRLSSEGQALADRVCSPQVMLEALMRLLASGGSDEPGAQTDEAATLTH
jgi:glycosyltransferase involved in cell wall biosynthesis